MKRAAVPSPERLRAFAHPNAGKSLVQLGTTVTAFSLLWLALFLGIRERAWVVLLLVIPAGGFLSRIFVIMHDCSHRSYFRSRFANDLCGTLLGLLCFTPFTYWRITHEGHHATLSDLSRRGTGDVETLTVPEYEGLPRRSRAWYRIMRSPFVVFAIAPAYVFLLRYRFPFSAASRTTWLSTLGTNLTLGLIAFCFWREGELGTLCLTHGPLLAIMATLAVWLFYVEHQFADTYWTDSDKWNSREAALWGSSHVDLPRLFRYFTANIGPHHIHHLNCRIPNYRLYECLQSYPELALVNRLTLWQALKATALGLWDGNQQKLVGFRDARNRSSQEFSISRGCRTHTLDAGFPQKQHGDIV